MKTYAIPCLLLSCCLTAITSAREWTSADGRKLNADFVSSTGDAATLRRPGDSQTFVVPFNRLSEDDQAWIKQQPQAPGKPSAGGMAKPIEGPFASLITGDWALSEHDGLKFALYGGKDLTAAEKIPLILTLHGRSKNEENGKQVGGWMKSFVKPANYAAHPCFVVAPLSAQPESGEGYGWNGKEVDQVLKLVKAMVKSLPVDPKRIYIAGHSMGGFGTCHVMGKEPRLFAAGIPVAGCSNGDTTALMRKPMWMFHATDDATVPVSTAQDFAKLMKVSKQFKFSELPVGGHGVVGKVFDDPETHKWLFDQRLK